MTHFERIGREWQESAMNTFQAQKSFRRSCDICCERGYHIDCDQCEIRQAHNIQMDVLRFLEAERREREVAAAHDGQKVSVQITIRF